MKASAQMSGGLQGEEQLGSASAEAGQGENGLLGIFGCLKKEGLQTENMLFRLFFIAAEPCGGGFQPGGQAGSTGKRNVSFRWEMCIRDRYGSEADAAVL